MLRREIFAGVTSAASLAHIVIRLTYAGDQLCHGLDVASRTWPIFFGCNSTGPGSPGSFVDDCLTEPAQPPPTPRLGAADARRGPLLPTRTRQTLERKVPTANRRQDPPQLAPQLVPRQWDGRCRLRRY